MIDENSRRMSGEVGTDMKETANTYLRSLAEGHRRLFHVLAESQKEMERVFPFSNGENGDDGEKKSTDGGVSEREQEEVAAAFSEWCDHMGKALSGWISDLNRVGSYLKGVRMEKYLGHDLRQPLSALVGFSELLGSDIKKKRMSANVSQHLHLIVLYVERCWVAIQDILLRRLSDTEVPKEYATNLDVEMLERLLGYIQNKELGDLKRNGLCEGSAYSKAGEKTVNLEVDWRKLKKDLAGRKVKGNDGVVGNFILNALRNALKDKVGSSFIALNVQVDGDELVIQIMNDGSAIDQQSLTPGSDSFIFKEGVSQTKSTGLGLAYSDQRIKSLGGSLSVVSRGRGENAASTFSNAENFQFDLDEFNRKREAVAAPQMNTVFEVKLPIVNH